ncbi:MAG: N-acetylmuramoyl-L-alanine amidase [Oscillospiraceae bacterium]|nr:N-acetylmuramoyl-L-alanine amidase [Oscillospiraceae bacterium]
MRKRVRRGAWVTLIILAAAACFGYILRDGRDSGRAYEFLAVDSAAAPPPLRTIVVDAGHGGLDGGAVSPGGRSESAYNLEIALKTELFLRFLGMPSVMTRREDISLHDGEQGTIRQKKNADLRNRAARVNSTDGAVLLSIHQNMFSDPRYSGAQVFYNGRTESKALAQTMQNALRACIDPDNRRQPGPVDTLLMNEARCPAILVECGFLSNTAEEALLRDPIYQTKLAMVMSITVTDWVISTENQTNN